MNSVGALSSRDLRDDSGGAIVEFIAMSLLLLVPVVYLVVAIATVQAGTYAAELAAREAARSAAIEGVRQLEDGERPRDALAAASTRADAAAALALADFGFDAEDHATLELACTSRPCFEPGSDIRASIAIRVPLPGFPAAFASWIPLAVTVSAEGSSAVEDYGSDE